MVRAHMPLVPQLNGTRPRHTRAMATSLLTSVQLALAQVAGHHLLLPIALALAGFGVVVALFALSSRGQLQRGRK